jgi:hypothetical protein
MGLVRDLLGFAKIFTVLTRNQLLYMPKARRAKKHVKNFLRQRGWKTYEVSVGMGLLNADGLYLCVILLTDADLAAFQASTDDSSVDSLFRSSLSKSCYPAEAVPSVHVSFYSYEYIERHGGYTTFFM